MVCVVEEGMLHSLLKIRRAVVVEGVATRTRRRRSGGAIDCLLPLEFHRHSQVVDSSFAEDF